MHEGGGHRVFLKVVEAAAFGGHCGHVVVSGKAEAIVLVCVTKAAPIVGIVNSTLNIARRCSAPPQ